MTERLSPSGSEVDFSREALEAKISDEELGVLLVGVGNHEAKSLLLVLMNPLEIYTATELMHLINRSQANGGWEREVGTGLGYARHSLVPTGLVSKEEVLKRNRIVLGFSKTAYGASIGESFAGHLLDFSEKNPDVSLQDLFGYGNSSSKKRAIIEDKKDIVYKKSGPLVRLKIFRALVGTSTPLRITDLAEMIGEDPILVEHHLGQLKSKGIINYTSSRPGNSLIRFKLREDKPKVKPEDFRGIRGLVDQVYSICLGLSDSEVTFDSVLEGFKAMRGEMDIYLEEYIKHLLPNILSHLEKGGYLSRVGKFNHAVLSEVSINESQRIMLLELVNLLSKFQGRDLNFIDEGKKKARDIAADPKRVALLMKKAREKSPAANADSEKAIKAILSIIDSTKGIPAYEICKILNEMGITLSRHSVNVYLKRFRNEEKTKTEGEPLHYFPEDHITLITDKLKKRDRRSTGRRVVIKGTEIYLSRTEVLILEALANSSDPVSIKDLYYRIYGKYPADENINSKVFLSIRTRINELREKIRSIAPNTRYIKNVYGNGWILLDPNRDIAL